jgi:hypothetical protein
MKPKRKTGHKAVAPRKAVVKRQVKAVEKKATNRQSLAIIPPPASAQLTAGERLEAVLINGDLKDLSPEERVDYYRRICVSLGLNSLTRPFEYILFKNYDGGPEKLSLYARKDCAEQLRKIHHVGCVPPLRRVFDHDRQVVMVEADFKDRNGKTDTATGAVPLRKYKNGGWVPLTDVEYCNAIMKAETKAKRRGALSICGLSMLDESELDGVIQVGGVTRDGHIYRYQNEIRPQGPVDLPIEGGSYPDGPKALQAKNTLDQVEKTDEVLAKSTDALEINNATGLPMSQCEQIAAANRKKNPSPQAEPKAASPSKQKKGPQLEAETVGPDEFIIRGDVDQCLPMIEKACRFSGGWWRCNLESLQVLQEFSNKYNFDVNVLPAKAAGKKEKPATKPDARPSKGSELSSARLVSITVQSSNAVKTSKNNDMRKVKGVTNGGETLDLGCFHASLFPFLDDASRLEFYMTEQGNYKNIVGIKRMLTRKGKQVEFDEDGKTPIIDNATREPGTQSRLY